MNNNAEMVYRYFSELDTPWAGEAIAGMLGNMQAESTINPGLWENGDKNNQEVGFGLVQWTPASKYIEWAKYTFMSGDTQCRRIEWERANNTQFAALSVLPKYVNDALGIARVWATKDASGPVDIPGLPSFNAFAYKQGWPIVSYPGVYADLTNSLDYAAWVFLLQYERPENQNQPQRATFAREWADYLGIRHKLKLNPIFFSHWLKRKKKNRKVVLIDERQLYSYELSCWK